jgi:acyl carrier protein
MITETSLKNGVLTIFVGDTHKITMTCDSIIKIDECANNTCLDTPHCQCDDCNFELNAAAIAEQNRIADQIASEEKSIPKPIIRTASSYDNIELTVLLLLQEQMGLIQKPNPNDHIDSLGIDSLDAVEITMAFEEEFQIEIPDSAVEIFASENMLISDIINYIRVRINPESSTLNYHVDYMKGLRAGVSDRSEGNPSLYLAGDQLGADSARHASYIDGYICGFA